MPEYSASLGHWASWTLTDLGSRSFDDLSAPSSVATLSADMILAPVTSNDYSSNYLLDALYTAYAKQFSKLWDANYTLGLLRKIEFCQGTDLDTIWGQVYRVRRRTSETDDNYRKRLQVYIKQLVGSGTKYNCEEIINIIVEKTDACRIDTYWPGFCRIYIIDGDARVKARARTDLINLIAPQMLPAGVTYQFYIPYYDLDADMVVQGPVYSSLPAYMALRDKVLSNLSASIYMAERSAASLDSDVVIAEDVWATVRAYEALQGPVPTTLTAREALSGAVPSNLDASEALSGRVTVSLVASERVFAENRPTLPASVVVRARAVRPIEARGHLADKSSPTLTASMILAA